ncbi:MAG: T9SS type A sorting domain-containing protein, partial [Bacteroidia bacterium]
VNITGNVNATSVLRFLDTKFFTLNGNNGSGNGITIRGAYTGTNTNATVFLAASSAPTLGCKRGSIKQVNVYGAPALAAAGIFAGLDGNFNTGGNHDSIDISFNRVFRASQAIRVFGVNAVTAAIDVLTINSNTVGPATSTPTIDCISDVGINVGKVIGLKLNNNLIQNCLTNGLMTSETLSLSVSDNTIRAISGPSFTFARGMSIGIDTKGGVFKNNFIYDVKNIYPGGFGAQGMYINVGQYSGLRFENNMIYDIKSYAATNYTSWPVGIYLEDAGNIDINNNSVSLSGSNNSTSGATGSSAFLATGSFTTSFFEIKLSNNIFSNTYDHANSSTDVCYSVYSTITASNYTVMNYNDYYVGGTGNNPMLAWKLGINLSNLTSLQSSFGNNLSSYNVAPVFVSPTDLHLVTSANPALDNNGIPIAGLNTDIDYQLRSTTVPDIGADEFVNNSPCTSVLYGNIVTASISACSNTTVPVNFIGGGSGTGFNYQWQVSLNPGGPYTNVIGGVGANTTNYVTPTLTVGVYYYVLQKTCIAASLTSISNEAAVTINPTPNVTASGNSPICSGGNLVLNATTDIGSTNTWIGPSGPIIAPLNWTLFNVSPGMSGNYIFVSSLGSCSAMATVTVLISSPIQLTVSVNPSTICVGSSSTLSAVGATSYTWDAINSQSIVVSPTLSVSYYFLHTNSNGCLDSALVYVYLYPSPVISTSANMICNGQTSTLAISGATSFTWDSGVTTQSIIVTPSITSTYSVTGISQSGCTFSVNETVTVSLCTGIFKDVFSFTNIYILPNPNTGILSIEIPYEGFTIENTQIKIVNVLGQEVKQFNLNNKKQHLNIEELANGVYYLNLIKDNKIIETKKIIKQ